jgi:hypothetical protein
MIAVANCIEFHRTADSAPSSPVHYRPRPLHIVAVAHGFVLPQAEPYYDHGLSPLMNAALQCVATLVS